MNAHVLMIDNFDSFTFNVVQALGALGARVTVSRNDAFSVEQALALSPSHVVISPGPGRPENAGVSVEMIRALCGRAAVLGICLGHQALATAFGGVVGPAGRLMHGKSSRVYHDGRTLYQSLPNPFLAGRYHSLAVNEEDLPEVLTVSAYTSQGEVMGIRHREHAVEGVQFHPESVLTPEGQHLLQNFLALDARREVAA